jgi:hypothetical protein
MVLEQGLVDPIFACQLALELHMPVGELGQRMSAHELGVVWPAYFAWLDEERKREEAHDSQRGR